MTIEVKAALEAAETIGAILARLSGVKSKLTARPDSAVRDLVEALKEVEATFSAVAAEIARYKGLGVTPEALRSGAPALSELEGTVLRVRVDAARGHCSVLDNIYRA